MTQFTASEPARATKKIKKPIAKPPKRAHRKSTKAKQESEAVEEPTRNPQYYQNFDFYFKRTCFRTMTLYFKTTFKPFFEKWKGKRSKGSSVHDLLTAYTEQTMPQLLALLPAAQRSAFTEMLKLVVFSHRHNKNDAFLANLAVDFGVVREPMYKYSKVA